MPMNHKRIGFIGGGNMAEALIKGLIDKGFPSTNLFVADPSEERRKLLRDRFMVSVMSDNLEVVRSCKLLVLAVKPQLVNVVVPALVDAFTDEHLLISILAGTTTTKLETLLGERSRIVRVMPNTPALIGAGISALCKGQFATDADLLVAQELLKAVGEVCLVNESQMDAVTGLSGSGPAYIFSVLEGLIEGGVAQGLSPETALELATQTVSGAAQLVAATGEAPASLRAKVCSPGGTTLAGLTALEEGDLKGIMSEAVARATQRSKELGQDS
ncbi:MAG: pyrroline-5-carboxylate reductase [Deltaproteobacteria bacterium]|nr:pyrroline-5-carboxylate reductase [Deltaproteobacteria bacterium]